MASNSPRQLVLDTTRAAIARANSNGSDGDLNDILLPGEQQVCPSYKPRLDAGLYTVHVRQNIKFDEKNTLGNEQSKQRRKVITPQYVLPENLVHSKYPEEGSGATRETLPHIVLNDPHFPWDRKASKDSATAEEERNVTPWLALLVFTLAELTLDKEDLNDGALSAVIPEKTASPLKQTSTLAINLSISTLKSLEKAPQLTSPISKADFEEDESSASTNLIFIKPALFNELFKIYDKNGQPLSQINADVSRYQYLTHVRKVCSDGVATTAQTEKVGMFSTIISHRTGPLDSLTPSPVLVHLVSIEGIPDMSWPVSDTVKYVPMASLHSWTYMCLPSSNIHTEMKKISEGLSMLRAPESVISGLAGASTPDIARVQARLKDGYALTRYRTETGEVITAVMRGALAPVMVPSPLAPMLTRQSNSGADLRIFDSKVGMIDITYSAAWQLGKTLALADQSFCVALSRMRSIVERIALDGAKTDASKELNVYEVKGEMPSSMLSTAQKVASLPGNELVLPNNLGLRNRWQSAVSETAAMDLSLNNSAVRDGFSTNVGSTVKMMASSATSDRRDDDVYNEFNKPYSSDWMTILSWILDKMFLHNIPAEYLIVDPSYLPSESLRFFHIDANWIDALLDGALSIGNYLGGSHDHIREEIKVAVNRYIECEIPGLGRTPQIPTFGFFLRSDLIRQLPEILVNAAFDSPAKPDPMEHTRAAILRQEITDTGLMLCLLDRSPVDKIKGLLKSLTFTQPPHQQSFVVGEFLDSSSLRVAYKYIPSNEGFQREDHNVRKPEEWTKLPSPSSNPNPVFIWGEKNEIRTLILPSLFDNVFQTLETSMSEDILKENSLTSAMMAIHLSNPGCVLNLGSSVNLQLPTKHHTETSIDRTLKMIGGSYNESGSVVMKGSATI
ncbi:hypothetical protein H2198_008089 [Neophaeococcomyces mojaviensis]|uniref:Uncharacterized protein n=1 Tax=Neophaeococcomyces mojaviensis TaxID=3383035 RepID=A0ACC2ZY74_9EURO|nr:hypothetical protein H2198_008089 [Knufia sp. JES_112]